MCHWGFILKQGEEEQNRKVQLPRRKSDKTAKGRVVPDNSALDVVHVRSCTQATLKESEKECWIPEHQI